MLASAGSSLAVLLVLYRLLNQPGPNDLVGLRYGAWLGLVAALVMLAGCWGAIARRVHPRRGGARASRAARRPPPRLTHRRCSSRDQVLHVARLARLELTDEEVERFGGELSKVLDHIEKISELGDLADVPPTSHVIDVENALRADEPRPVAAGRERARDRPGRRARRLPRPEPGGRMRCSS